jgi:hypothetical protein
MSIPAHVLAILAGRVSIAPAAPLPPARVTHQGACKAPRTQPARAERRMLELPELESHDLPVISSPSDSLSFSWVE